MQSAKEELLWVNDHLEYITEFLSGSFIDIPVNDKAIMKAFESAGVLDKWSKRIWFSEEEFDQIRNSLMEFVVSEEII